MKRKLFLLGLILVIIIIPVQGQNTKVKAFTTGSLEEYPDGRVVKSKGDIFCGSTQSGGKIKGYAKFDLRTIPDDAIITKVGLHFLVRWLRLRAETFIRRISSDPEVLSPSALSNQVVSGRLLATRMISSTGWHYIDLADSGIQAVQNSLTHNWLALGWQTKDSPDAPLAKVGGTGSGYEPYLQVTYAILQNNPLLHIVSPGQNKLFYAPARVLLKIQCPENYSRLQYEFQWQKFLDGVKSRMEWASQNINSSDVKRLIRTKGAQATRTASVYINKAGRWRFRVRSLNQNTKWSPWREFQVK